MTDSLPDNEIGREFPLASQQRRSIAAMKKEEIRRRRLPGSVPAFVAIALASLVTLVAVAGCMSPRGATDRPFPSSAILLSGPEGEEFTRSMAEMLPVRIHDAKELVPNGILRLETARRIALSGNPDISAAGARVEAARARLMQAGSRYYPSVSFSHSSTRTFLTPANRNRLNTIMQPAPTVPTDIGSEELGGSQNLALNALLSVLRKPLFGGGALKGNHNPFSEHTTALTASWTIFDGFIREAQLMATKHLHHASQLAYLDARRIIVHAVDTAYYQVQLAEEQVRVARADEAFSRDQLLETEKLRAARRASKADVDNFKVRVLAAQAKVKQATGVRDVGKVVLAELMGLPDDAWSQEYSLSKLEDETPAEMATPEEEEWVERALSYRPDLRQMEQMLRSYEDRVRAAKGLYIPSLAVSGSWGFDHSSNLRYSEEDQSAAAAFELRWDLFTGGFRKGRVLEAQSEWVEAAADYRKLRLAVRADALTALIDLDDAQEQIRLHSKALTTAAENRRIVQAAYVAGKETLNRLNEVQRDYTTADADLALSRIRLRQSWSDLAAAAGTFSPQPPEAGPPHHAETD